MRHADRRAAAQAIQDADRRIRAALLTLDTARGLPEPQRSDRIRLARLDLAHARAAHVRAAAVLGTGGTPGPPASRRYRGPGGGR